MNRKSFTPAVDSKFYDVVLVAYNTSKSTIGMQVRLPELLSGYWGFGMKRSGEDTGRQPAVQSSVQPSNGFEDQRAHHLPGSRL